mmetsp:Transcript_19732/g.56414  ORF Transcript_19732/g.56414 Transcript_19732/m.56414 type:complete len:82 (+) Transcript_19732:762-1007(+)
MQHASCQLALRQRLAIPVPLCSSILIRQPGTRLHWRRGDSLFARRPPYLCCRARWEDLPYFLPSFLVSVFALCMARHLYFI